MMRTLGGYLGFCLLILFCTFPILCLLTYLFYMFYYIVNGLLLGIFEFLLLPSFSNRSAIFLLTKMRIGCKVFTYSSSIGAYFFCLNFVRFVYID